VVERRQIITHHNKVNQKYGRVIALQTALYLLHNSTMDVKLRSDAFRDFSIKRDSQFNCPTIFIPGKSAYRTCAVNHK
jgi:hypothetical protein